MLTFSIIICAYNPQQGTMQRLLQAVQQLNDSSVSYEVIIVDNNSSPALKISEAVKLLQQNEKILLLIETTPGLTAARVTGINAAKNEWLVFFDDDNEPAIDYLSKASIAISQYSKVGAWGPGSIEVVFTNATAWLNTKKELFQQRNDTKTKFDNQAMWLPCYPFGTGLVIKKEIAFEYMKRVQNGRYTLSDRKGKSLASGGDVQLVLTGIEMGFAAGVIDGLSLNHLIVVSKANLSYLLKQQYGTASAYIKAYNEVFISNQIQVSRISNYNVLKKIYSLYRIHRMGMSKNDFKLLLASKLGELNASVFETGQSKPLLLKWYEKLIHD